MQLSLDDKVLRVNGVTVQLSPHVILSVICRAARAARAIMARLPHCGDTHDRDRTRLPTRTRVRRARWKSG